MYTVMIVEDEVLIRVGLRNMIRWNDMDMTIVGEAQNGRQGLQLYYEKKPDIILTDIKMPVMDGLEMILQIRKIDTVTKIIVLTSYEEFELVRQAFKMGISDYILKVKMLPEDMENVVNKVKQELLQERVEEKGDEDWKDAVWQKSDLAAKCRDYMIDQTYTYEEFRKLGDNLHITERGIVVCTMRVSPYDKRKSTEQMNGDKQYTGKMCQLIVNLIQEILDENDRGIVLQENEKRYLLLLSFREENTKEEREAGLKKFLSRIQNVVQNYMNRNAIFGVSSFAESYKELHRLYTEAVKAEEISVFLGKKLTFSDWERACETYKDMLNSFGKQVTQMDWLTDGCRLKILKEISFQRNAKEPGVDVMRESFSRWIHRSSFGSIVQKENALEIAMKSASLVRQTESLAEMIHIFEQYSQTMLETANSRMVSIEVTRTVAYIRAHYFDKDISLSRAASEVGMNKDYLSSLLKRETGIGFSDYVNRLRISKAQELLKTTNKRSYEIAQEVGFQDESYFSRVFKRMVGVRPNEYKKHELKFEEFVSLKKE